MGCTAQWHSSKRRGCEGFASVESSAEKSASAEVASLADGAHSIKVGEHERGGKIMGKHTSSAYTRPNLF